jgi:predicted permease
MENSWQDLRFGVRVLLKHPGFTALAILVLGLGIGANTAMFTLINAFLLRPIAGRNPDELVSCFSRNTKTPGYRAFSYPDYVEIRDRNSVFSSLLAHDETMVGITQGETTRRVFADVVSANFFSTFGLNMFQGRAFLPEEERPGSAAQVVIVSHEYWRRIARDPELVGKTLRVNGKLFTVTGITPEEFTGTMAMFAPSIYLPLGAYDATINDLMQVSGRKRLADRTNHCLFLVGRLKPGVTQARADADLAVIASQLEKAYPAENRDQTFHSHAMSRLSTSTEPSNDSELRTVSVLLSAMASLVLLIACLNLANMLLARGSARRKEFAIRLSLGGGRGRLIRQLMTEGLILSALGGALGLVLAWWGSRVLISSMAGLIPLEIVYHSGPDLRVMAAMLAFCGLSTIVFGLGPALKFSRPDVVTDLKEHAGEDAGSRRRSFFARRNLLVMTQVSLSLTLLVVAGLTIRGARRAAQTDPGFKLDNGVFVELDPSLAGYEEARGRALYGAVLERLRALPGVDAASLAATVPFGTTSLGRAVHRAGDIQNPADPAASGRSVPARFNAIGADYFGSLGLKMLRGRQFNPGEAETGSAPPAAIVDQELATRLWPNEDPIGKRVQFGAARSGETLKTMEVVGVAPPIRETFFEHGPVPHVYIPFGQDYHANAHLQLRLAARGKAAEDAVLTAIRDEVRAVDERLPVMDFRTMRGHFEESIELWVIRTGARMFSTFGALALFLAMVGVYGVKAYTVARRTREIGIRMALGATKREALWLILGDGIRMTSVGIIAGLLLALAAAQLLSSVVYEVSSTDPLVFTVTPALLMAVALIACYLPARRAAKIDPMTALRWE